MILDSLLTGPRAFVGRPDLLRGRLSDARLLGRVFTEHPDIGCTIHMAARIVVPESVAEPATYYRDNVSKSLELFDRLSGLGQHRVIFSSSASVYAPVDGFEVTEQSPVAPSSPYARSKLMTEQMLEDLAAAGRLSAVVLRYFNPIGSDPDLTTGVYDRRPSHVLGQMTMAALGRQDRFTVTGTRHPTRDGTGLRDYLHVWDLAEAHVAAVERFDDALRQVGSRSTVVNVGTGQGVTVRELLAMFEAVLGRRIPTVEAEARPGDSVGGVRQRRQGTGGARLAVPAEHRGRGGVGAGLGRATQSRCSATTEPSAAARSLTGVNELFAPPGTDWQPVSPALARLRHAVLLVSGVGRRGRRWWSPPCCSRSRGGCGCRVVVVVAGLLVWGWVLVDRNARSWGYAEREEDLYVKRGALFRRLVVVPYGRMQYVDVQAGPLEQAFKVASRAPAHREPGHERPHPRVAGGGGGPAPGPAHRTGSSRRQPVCDPAANRPSGRSSGCPR